MLEIRKSLVVNVTVLAGIICFGLFGTSAYAQCSSQVPSGNYALAVQVAVQCGTASSNTAQGFFNFLDTSGLSAVNNLYTGQEVANIYARFNGVPFQLWYQSSPAIPIAGTRLVLFAIPGVLPNNIHWDGPTRANTEQQFVQYLKSTLLSQILSYQASNSPTSPITGVGGLLPNAVASDFNQNFMDTATNIAAPASAAAAAASGGSTPNLIGVALQYSSFSALDRRTKVTSIPLSYTIRNDIDPRRQLTFSVPLTQVDVDGAKAYIAGFGVSYRVPMNDNWTLTPAGKISGVGSVDLATASGMYTGSLTSTYIWDMDTYNVAMGNMLSYNRTAKIQSGEYSSNPDITSTVVRNGLMLSQPANWNGQKLSVEYSLVDTRYTGGTKLYIDNTQEIGITVGTNKNAFSARSFLRGGLTYLHGKDTKGFTANIGYWF